MARILIDMDGVIVQFEGPAIRTARPQMPESEVQEILRNQKLPYIEDCVPEDLKNDIDRVTSEQGFFLNLPMIDGAKEAIEYLIAQGHDIWFCTSPLSGNPFCASEKVLWVKNNLSKDLSKKVIITKDKTLVQGDYLIDDKPVVAGVISSPTWQHIIFDQPYNTSQPGPRINWQSFQNFAFI